MPLTFNGNTPENINWNGVALSKVMYNGGVVWEKVSGPFTFLGAAGWNSANENATTTTFSGYMPKENGVASEPYYGFVLRFRRNVSWDLGIPLYLNMFCGDYIRTSGLTNPRYGVKHFDSELANLTYNKVNVNNFPYPYTMEFPYNAEKHKILISNVVANDIIYNNWEIFDLCVSSRFNLTGDNYAQFYAKIDNENRPYITFD